MEISNLHGSQSLSGPHFRKNPTNQTATIEPPKGRTIQDAVQFSDAAKRIADVGKEPSSSSGIRFDLVNRVKAEIANGTYETPDKLNTAVERMLAR